MHFIDIAANLTDRVYSGVYGGTSRHAADMQQVLSRARAAGVTRTIVTAGTLRMAREALSLSTTDPSLFSTVGVHPTRSTTLGATESARNSSISALAEVARDGGKRVVAIGECGLDYDRLHFASRETQIPAFEAQFSLAETTRLPMFFHDRNTKGEFAEIVRKHRQKFTGGVVHSFTGTAEDRDTILQLDLYIGINGCSLKTEENLDVVRGIPLEKIMLETDCPYCSVRPSHAGFSFVKSKWLAVDKKKFDPEKTVKGRVEPCHIRQVCEVVAGIKGISEEDVARAAFNNSMQLFFPEEAEQMGSSPYDLSIGAVPNQ